MSSKKTQDMVRKQDRELKKAGRGLDRDLHSLEREEKKLEAEIKKAAKTGNKQVLAIYAKQLVQVRKQKARIIGTGAKITATGHQIKTMSTQASMAQAMAKTTKTMHTVNAQVKLPELQKTMMNYEKETTKMDMAGEMMDDTLDSILAGSDEEEETEAIVGKVLDEIGIEMTSKLVDAPKTKLKGETVGSETEDLERQLRALQTS